MKKFLILSIIVLCGALTLILAQIRNEQFDAAPVQAAAQVQATNTEYLSPTPAATHSPIPSPTIGYESTLAVAQSTADEARRVNAEVTAQHEQAILSMLQLTAAHEQSVLELARMTAVAGPTIFPMTQTQQAAINAQASTGQALIAGQLTATYQAPTQEAALIAARVNTEYLVWRNRVELFAMAGIGLFTVALAIFFAFRWRAPEVKPIEPQTETVIQMRANNGGGTFQQTRLVVPCSPEQLTELAEMVANGEKRFGINRLESSSRTFRGQRPVLLEVRQFLIDAGLVIPDANGTITLNEVGEEFFAVWFEHHKLPDKFEIGEDAPEDASEEVPETETNHLPTGLT